MPRGSHYRQLVTDMALWEKWATRLIGVKSECLKQCALAFLTNIRRIDAFATMPASIAFEVKKDSVFLSNALIRANLIRETSLDEVSSLKIPSSVQEDIAAHNVLWTLNQIKNQKHYDDLGIKTIEGMVESQDSMGHCIDLVFSSIILSSWTAFECLVSDLWVAAVDNPTKEISNRVASQNFKGDPLASKTAHQNEFDSRSQYGSFLRDIGHVSFARLELIKKNYEIAFGGECVKAFDEIVDGYIHALSATRNLLIHKSGKADKEFVRAAQRFPELKAIRKDQNLVIDGRFTKKLNLAALGSGVSLINYVDGLLLGEYKVGDAACYV